MTVKIQSVHFDADKKLLAFVEERVDKLTHFYDGIIKSEVILKLDKGDAAENKIAEIKLHIAGNDLFAKKQCKSFEEAVDTSIDALKAQVKKHKEKVQGLLSLLTSSASSLLHPFDYAQGDREGKAEEIFIFYNP